MCIRDSLSGIGHLLQVGGDLLVAQLLVALVCRLADLVESLVDLIQSSRVGLGLHTYLYLVIPVSYTHLDVYKRQTGPLGTADADPTVSIHALLAECDRSPRVQHF